MYMYITGMTLCQHPFTEYTMSYANIMQLMQYLIE